METGNKEIHSYKSSALQARLTSGMVGAYLCSTEPSASWQFFIHMCCSSKHDVMYLTVSHSESDLEESDTAVLCKRHYYHLHVNLQICNIFELLISNPVVG